MRNDADLVRLLAARQTRQSRIRLFLVRKKMMEMRNGHFRRRRAEHLAPVESIKRSALYMSKEGELPSVCLCIGHTNAHLVMSFLGKYPTTYAMYVDARASFLRRIQEQRQN